MKIWLIPVGDGLVTVAASNTTSAQPVMELAPGEFCDDVPYEVWLANVGRTVRVEDLKPLLAAGKSESLVPASTAAADWERRQRRVIVTWGRIGIAVVLWITLVLIPPLAYVFMALPTFIRLLIVAGALTWIVRGWISE